MCPCLVIWCGSYECCAANNCFEGVVTGYTVASGVTSTWKKIAQDGTGINGTKIIGTGVNGSGIYMAVQQMAQE